VFGLQSSLQPVVDGSGLHICVAVFTTYASPLFHEILCVKFLKREWIIDWKLYVPRVPGVLSPLSRVRKATHFWFQVTSSKCWHFPFYALYWNMFSCWPCISIHPCNENQLDALFILSLFRRSVARCWWRSWLRHCATSRKVAGLIPDGVIGNFHWHNPSGRNMGLGLTQPLTEMSTRNIFCG